jgi:hypothetical protein
MSIFDEQYRVVAVEGDHLLVRGVRSDEVLTIVNPEPKTPLTQEDFPPGECNCSDRPLNFGSELGASGKRFFQGLDPAWTPLALTSEETKENYSCGGNQPGNNQ